MNKLKTLTQEVMNTTCDYLTKVAAIPITSLTVKNFLRNLGYEANQFEVSRMISTWYQRQTDVVSYLTYEVVAPKEATEEEVDTFLAENSVAEDDVVDAQFTELTSGDDDGCDGDCANCDIPDQP